MNEDGTTLSDVVHDLLVYRIDQKRAEDGPQFYFTLPSTVLEQQKLQALAGPTTSKKQSLGAGSYSLIVDDSLQIATLVCSTKLTHNVNLMGLLKWRDNPKGLEKHLRSFMHVDGEEIVKFLQDTLDALFNILMENSDSDLYDNLVFDALVFLVGLVSDMKYSHFKPVLDVYIQETFSATLAYNKLMVVLKYYIESLDVSKVDSLLRAIKSLEYIFKFIIRSRLLFAALNDNRGHQHFESSLHELFGVLNKLMADSQEKMLIVQEAVLTYLPSIVGDVIIVISPVDVSLLLVEFINSIPRDRLLGPKIQFINTIIHSVLFPIPECRQVLLPNFLGHVTNLMASHLEVDACIKTLSDIMDLLFELERTGSMFEDMNAVCMTSLRTVVQTFAMASPKSKLVCNCVAVVTAVLRQMTEGHYRHYVDHFETTTDLSDFLMEILTAIEQLVTVGVYPTDWNEMILLQNWVFLKALRYFSNTIRDSFTNPFQFGLWMRFFNSAIAFATQPSLQLEQFSINKRNKIISRYRDMRREMSFEIRSLWFNLGQHKIEFIPEIVGPILQMTLIPENELRKRTIPIFFDMMQCEFMSLIPGTRNHKRNFLKFEQEMIFRLDRLITDSHGDEHYQEMFYEIIKGLCDAHTTMRDCGLQFVGTVKQLMQLLLEYRAVVMDSDNRDCTMCCTVNLLNFYRDIQRYELYILYLDKLCDLHLECDNFTEAAYTLMLYTKMINWSDEPLSPLLASNKYPKLQLHRELKESLYYDIIKYFDQGKMWEMGINLCKELALQHELETFDYLQLSSILRRQADLYDSIMTKIRPEPEYFRVAYYGLGFPSFLQNRVFIYRGKEYERHSDFVARLQNQFPNAQLMKTLNPPTEAMRQQVAQYLQINKVTPVMELKEQIVGKQLSEQILKYYKVNEVQKFTYSRRRDDISNDVTNMWVERTILVTTFPLPGILRWFPVTSMHMFEVSPLELAIETIEETNQKISSLVDQHRADPSLKVDPLGMILNGVVDAAVNGGIANYKLFYTEDYLRMHAQDREFIQKLRQATTTQMMILKSGLDIHRAKVHEALLPFHTHMESRYHEMKLVLEREYGIKLTDEDLQQELPSGMSAAVKRVQSMPASRHIQAGTLASRTDVMESPGTTGRGSHITSSTSFCFPAMSQTAGAGSSRSDLLRSVQGRLAIPHSSTATATGTNVGNTDSITPAASHSVTNFNTNTIPRESSRRTVNQSPRSSIVSITSTTSSSSKTSDSRDSTVIELNQQLITTRPRRPDSESSSRSRPTSSGADSLHRQGHSLTPTMQPLVMNLVSVECDDASPPPLPEKSTLSSSAYSDYANIGTAAVSQGSGDVGSLPPLIRRGTHRDRPQLPLPTTPTLKVSPQHFPNDSTTTSPPSDDPDSF
jgi:dedicator of cytokinesis protein 1